MKMEASVDPQCRGPDWMPITPKTGSLFHAETQFRTTGLLLLGAMALPASGIAQTTPAPPAITRTVVAATKLPTVTNVPLHFKAVSITLQPDEKSDVSAANGILYQPSSANDRAADLCAVEWQSLSAFADLNRQIALRGARQSPETLANPKTRDHRVQEEMRPPPQPKLAESSARLPPIAGCGRRTNQPPALNDWQSVCDHQMGDASHDRVEEFD